MNSLTQSAVTATITCPFCQTQNMEEIPRQESQFFYRCPNCAAGIRAKAGACCVFCSYGDRQCLFPIEL